MRDSTFYTLKYVAIELGENQDLIREVSSDMFSEHGCFTAYNNYPVTEQSIPIIMFTQEGIENVREMLADSRDHYVDQMRSTRRMYRRLRRQTPAA